MLLTDKERTRFIQWLKQDAQSTNLIIQQMKTLNLPQELTIKLQNEANAQELIATKLESIHTETITNNETP